MSVVCYGRIVLFLAFFAMVSLPDVSYAKDVKEITSTELKEIVRENKDKVVAVTFWATWCKICVEHLPELNTLYEKYKNKNVEIIGVSLDDKSKEVKDFIEKKGIEFPVLRAKDKEEMSYVYNVKKIPVIYYYKNGKLEHVEEGYTDLKHIEEDLRSCLEGTPPPSKDVKSTTK
ncbi:MAG: TlpA family protein disulfide reductase [Candidatus Brocadia sp.]|nr:TlpA family protein disulfide reductase [Candidatus Brocadia sp.]